MWGTWNGIVPRDAEALRRVATMLRFFGGRGGLLQSEEWEPHTPAVLTRGVFGSRFPNGTHTLYTLVNRAGSALREALIALPEEPRIEEPIGHGEPLVEASSEEATRYFDCYRGVELTPRAAPPPPHARHAGTTGATAAPRVVSLPLEAEGYGCVLGARGAAAASAPPLVAFLRKMAALSATPLQQISATWRYLPQSLVPIAATSTASAPPAGMVAIPAAANFSFVVRGIEIEGDDAHGVDVQYPWESHPQREHAHSLPVAAFYMDKVRVSPNPYRNPNPYPNPNPHPHPNHGQVPRDQRQLLRVPQGHRLHAARPLPLAPAVGGRRRAARCAARDARHLPLAGRGVWVRGRGRGRGRGRVG